MDCALPNDWQGREFFILDDYIHLAHSTQIRAIAAYGGVSISVPTEKEYKHWETNKQPQWLSKFPHGKIPAWEGKDGFLLFESVAIMRYIGAMAPREKGLYGKSPEDAALIDQWMHLMESEVEFNVQHINYFFIGWLAPYSKPIHKTFMERQVRGLNTIEQYLAGDSAASTSTVASTGRRTYFVGDSLTIADIYIATMMQRACSINLGTQIRAQIPNIMRHMEHVLNFTPEFRQIYGPTPDID
ncbi:glutathione S-transferase C-terminal-like protein [Mycena galericulata]|nr:glutathione S-transferase C-terminal-like protein [Mycena galericulata]